MGKTRGGGYAAGERWAQPPRPCGLAARTLSFTLKSSAIAATSSGLPDDEVESSGSETSGLRVHAHARSSSQDLALRGRVQAHMATESLA